jgi:hypothetical protein
MATTTTKRPVFWRAPGPWLVGASAVYLLVNVLRAALDPAGFARYFGIPLDGGDSGWVAVYASRTAILALLALVLLARRDLRVLPVFAALSVVGPASDAVLAARHHAGSGTVLRHLAIGLFLLLVAGLLDRQRRRTP